MRKLQLTLLMMSFLAFAACKNDKKVNLDEPDHVEDMTETDLDLASAEKVIHLTMEAKSDSGVHGEATFTERDGKVHLEAKFSNMTPGVHAIHIHENADCSSDDGSSAGGHWNPTHQQHGKWGDAEGYHKGDIGNFEVNEDGIGGVTFSTDEWCIGCEDETKNIVGKSLIVHESPDDFVTQPTGNAGGRVSCGGIIK